MTEEVTKRSRVLRELLASAEDLSAYGLVTETDMARMKVLCEEPPARSQARTPTTGAIASKGSRSKDATEMGHASG